MSFFPALLAFADGTLFEGYSLGLQGETTGEVVFNTAMTGYQEILTDPSYAGQIVTFTHPHIGNVGVNHADRESYRPWIAGLIVREATFLPSNFRAEASLGEWLVEQKVVGIAGIDTRQLTHYLRKNGTQMACISSLDPCSPEKLVALAREAQPMIGRDLTPLVTTQEPYKWKEGSLFKTSTLVAEAKHIVVYDFGVKYSILRQLGDRGCQVTVVPAHTSAEAALRLKPDGILLSNGPGDPQACHALIREIQQLLLTNLPILGICLGHQLLALALGAQTFKMVTGHHGANHPVKDLRNGLVQVTSQNHNFAVEEASLPDELEVTHRSLFDNTIQGFRHRTQPILGVQGHPEAAPGPLEASCIFDEFLALFS